MTTPSDAETPQHPELTPEDINRINDEAYKNYGPAEEGLPFIIGANYATLHERAAAQARMAEMEALLKRSVDLMCGANRNGILLEGAWWTEQIQELLRRKEIRPYKP